MIAWCREKFIPKTIGKNLLRVSDEMGRLREWGREVPTSVGTSMHGGACVGEKQVMVMRDLYAPLRRPEPNKIKSVQLENNK